MLIIKLYKWSRVTLTCSQSNTKTFCLDVVFRLSVLLVVGVLSQVDLFGSPTW